MTCQVHEGLLTTEEAEDCISIEFNPVRAGFHGSQEVWTRDVLNLGIKPDKLIAKVRLQSCQLCQQGMSMQHLCHVTYMALSTLC